MELPEPVIAVSAAQEIARDVVVIPDQRVPLVPNIGLIGGTQAVLVVDTGLGPRKAAEVLKFAREYAAGRRLYLTTTHFHPEHAFGAQAFAGEATYLVNQAQADDLATKGAGYLEMFRGLGEAVAVELRDVRIPTPDVVYRDTHALDLGDRVVQLEPTGRGHSLGDQVVTVDDIVFTGDLVEAGQFAIFPWFPPHDTDVSGVHWLAVMNRLTARPFRTVVPGHGDLGSAQLLTDTRDYLELLRTETWRRRDSAVSESTIIEEVTAVALERHPDWTGQDWIELGIRCLCAEHA